MVKIDIIAESLGAGKTTWINKMLTEAFDEKVVIIENECGETGIDGELLSGFDTHVKEITSGCICCTLYGDFVVAIRQMIKELHPSRILIEPTGLCRPNEIVRACNEALRESLAQINSVITIIDITMFPVFKEMGGALYKDQIETAHVILLSHLESEEGSQADLAAIARHPSKPVAQEALQSVFTSLARGIYGKVFRAKYIVTMNDGERVKSDYV